MIFAVAPFTGAWIEIVGFAKGVVLLTVAPFTGAWIEIGVVLVKDITAESLPSRERGLKFAPLLSRR